MLARATPCRCASWCSANWPPPELPWH